MENGDRSSAKKPRMESSPRNQVKLEVAGEEEAASGGRALLVLGGDATAGVAIPARIEIDRDMLHCPLCTLPLKPPIFQCGVGHMACGSCHGQLPTNQCHSCDGDGGGVYAPCPAMDAFVSKVLVPCPHEAYGCRASVAYYLAGDHGSACAHAPCVCGEPGCAFLGSPPMLLAHLAAAPHCWPVDNLQYGEALRIRVPDTEPRRLLVAEEHGGERAARAVPVTVACVRAPGAAAAGPQFTLKMWAIGCKGPASGSFDFFRDSSKYSMIGWRGMSAWKGIG
ncbi:unnamed protein product [Miscanthus lutarioriparius]|uniref:RING-type E3 ubiquitin transferase n=1 Tax=Miscanthus lutarioriparius TaxID=422564 RepID=A0A811SLI1_9POAL|nr:unnamed protein product [Miscanthus lutarioriparius]